VWGWVAKERETREASNQNRDGCAAAAMKEGEHEGSERTEGEEDFRFEI
jgi:hypothetical protein